MQAPGLLHEARPQRTRFDDVKVPKNKVVHLGPTVVLDEERCINCTRCVRFMAEVAKNPQLGQFDRGDRAVIGIFPGQPLDDPYAANVADICPVGALTNADFRFNLLVVPDEDRQRVPWVRARVLDHDRSQRERRAAPQAAGQRRGQPGLDV